MLRFGFLSRGSNLPRAGLLCDIPNRYPFVDRLGGDGITRITGVSAVLADTDTYVLPVSWIDALGATGVDHWAFTSTGIPKVIPGSVLIANGGGDQFYCGDKGLAGYAAPQNAAANAKIIRALRVPTYIDSLYYADHQEMDWSETNE